MKFTSPGPMKFTSPSSALEVRKGLDPEAVGRCNACKGETLTVNSIRIGDHVVRLCPSCTREMVQQLKGR
jgi:hypothetical protein